MTIGDNVVVTKQLEIIKSHITYEDKEKSCGYVEIKPEEECKGTILDYHSGLFISYWVVGLNDGRIIRIRA